MKPLLVILVGASTVLAACTAQAETAPTPTGSTADTPAAATPVVADTPTAATSPDLTEAEKAAVAKLVDALGVPSDQIKVTSSEAVTWPDGCLGVQKLGVMCTQALVPGYRIVLDAAGKQYECHTNRDGSIIVPAETSMQAPGTSQDAAIKQLANSLGIPVSEVKLVSSTAVEWPDSCLGVALEREMCAEMVTPGYLILLEAGGRQYEYHTNQDASSIMPATLAMNWKQEGGVAGLCQGVTVFLSGEIYGMDCAGNRGGQMGLLTSTQREQLYKWIDTLANTTVDLSDPQGVADRLTRTANLMGQGTKPASAADKRAVFDFGQSLYNELYR